MGETGEVLSRQYLSFILRNEHFAVEIARLREVLDVATLTRIPRMPDYICGVINLRGSVVPVIDLGYRLGMEPVEKTVNTCIMIVEVKAADDESAVEMGVLADAVQEVIDLDAKDIESPPKMGSGVETNFIKGMGRKDDKFLILLDIDEVLASEGEALSCDLNLLQDAAQAQSNVVADAHGA
ncbi:MAG: chemotaxis protein CheW [Desulfobulbaceae bacterium]|nr:chemotaxis protein CheW [Desulfobulbaceae bacterium]